MDQQSQRSMKQSHMDMSEARSVHLMRGLVHEQESASVHRSMHPSQLGQAMAERVASLHGSRMGSAHPSQVGSEHASQLGSRIGSAHTSRISHPNMTNHIELMDY